MRKVVIIGPAGAGKSTLARELGAILHMDVFHLDRYFWQPGWKERPKDARVEKLQELVQQDRWIIEGAYFSTSDIRLQSCDTVIVLDMPLYLCFWRVLVRRFSKQLRPDLPDGCKERLSIRYMAKLLLFPFIGRKTLVNKLDKVKHGECIVLHSRIEAEAFLNAQKSYASASTHQRTTPTTQLVPIRV